MKTLTNILAILFILSLAACGDGPQGPIGPQGPQGPQGPTGPQGAQGESGFVIEYEDVDFTGPEYEVFLDFGDFEVLPSDVALVYFLWDVQNIDGQDVEIWRQLPQTIFLPEGLLIYNFDFAVTDIKLFLAADFSLDLLGAMDTDDWIVRVVVVPGDFVNTGGRQDFSDYNKVKEILGLPELPRESEVKVRRN